MRSISQALLTTIYFFTLNSIAQQKELKIITTYQNEVVEIVSELGSGFGNVITIEGLIIEGTHKGSEDGPNIIVQKIGDSVIQKLIRIPLTPFWPSWEKFSESNKPNIQIGETYRLRAYETGRFEGVPWDAYQEANVMFQSNDYYFRNELRVISGTKRKTINYNPSDFIGREGLFTGKAKEKGNKSFIFGKDWKIELSNNFKWDSHNLNKEVEIYGIVKSTDKKDVFKIDSSKPRLIHLEDQLGEQVKLRGKAWSMNGYWWFNYRGTDIYVEDMGIMPNWSAYNHGQAIEISGLLVQEKKPDINQITLKANPDLKTYFTVKNATWKPINGLLVPEVMKELLEN